MTMGEQIKTLRRKLGLSQKELAGEQISRNMLSLIEHDSAKPSVKTLEYLSQRLGVSAAVLLGEDHTGGELDGARRCYASGEFEKAIALAKSRGNKEERNLLLSSSALKLAKKLLLDGNLQEAEKMAANALHWNEKTIYGTIELQLAAMETLLLCRLIKKESPEELLNQYKNLYQETGAEAKYHLLCSFVNLQQEHVQASERELWTITRLPDFVKPYYLFMRGSLALQQDKPESAIAFFSQAETGCNDKNLLRMLYEQGEKAAEESEDYKTAYEYAAKIRKIGE